MSSLTRALAACFILVGCAMPSFSQAHIVNVFCCAYQDPANGGSNVTIIPVGTTVQWVRTDFFPHTVTNGTGPSDPIAGTIFNGNLAGAATTFTFTFNTIGTFPYFCTFHAVQNMVGTVHVLPAATATPAGTGCNSSAGMLVLGTNSLPKVGNATFGFVLSGGPSGAQGFLFLSPGNAAAPLPVTPTCFAYLDLVGLQGFIAAGLTPTGPQLLTNAGSTTFTFSIPLIPTLGGATVSGQGLVFDGLAPGGLALSNAVTIVVGA
jgi:plastocyanin